jgi:ABC-type transporter Mla maintaining outer membrane lipid asymmetry ATPase subunit MlaF/ABC-type transporter Mla maintaining outer membrane lipid asymmetry permease subunit MlaE
MPRVLEGSLPDPASAGGPAVELCSLSVEAGDRPLLDSASAEFPAGRVTLVIGCSGAGKSVLLRILAGLIGPGHPEIKVSGKICFDGREILPWGDGAPEAGVVFQSDALFDELSPLDNVRLARAHRPKSRSSGEALDPVALLRELRVPEGVPTVLLSGGQRQRLAIARALAYDPSVILYDEPTSGLDPATAARVAKLIQSTHGTHPRTSIIVTHDYESLGPIADQIYLLDSHNRSLRRMDRSEWTFLRDHLNPPLAELPVAALSDEGAGGKRLQNWISRAAAAFGGLLVATSRVAEAAFTAPIWLLPRWRSATWGLRYLGHYLRLVTGPSAWFYIAIAGAIAGFVTTYFTFRYLPLARYTEPLVIEDLLAAIGFALYRVLVPVLATILIAARSGAAVASDVGGKAYGQQIDALRTFGIRPESYLLSGTLHAFLVGTPLLTFIAFYVARLTSLVVFTVMHPDRGPLYWHLHFHRELLMSEGWFYQGTGWLLGKSLLCGAGIGLIAYHQGAQRKHSSREVSRGITTTILWGTLYVLVVHFIFAFYEFAGR